MRDTQRTIAFVAVGVLAASSLAAQSITMSATTTSQAVAFADATNSGPMTTTIAAGTDVLAGDSALAGTSLSSGFLQFSVSDTAQLPTQIRLRQLANAAIVLWPTGPGFQAGNASSDTEIQVVLTSFVPIAVEIDVLASLITASSSCSQTVSATATVDGVTTPVPPLSVPGVPAVDQTVSTVIDASGLIIDLAGLLTAAACPGFGFHGGNVDLTWTIDVRAVDCGFMPYGTACGYELDGTSSDSMFPGQVVLRTRPQSGAQVPAYGVLFIGANEVAWPTPFGCALHTDYFAAVPLGLDAEGGSLIAFPPPTTPTNLTMQVGAVGPAVTFSNGLRIYCP